MSHEQKVVIVTGASQGIGAGLVAGFRERGYGVVATSRNIARHDDDQVVTVAGDIRDRATAARVVAAAKERFGRIDTLVNNAGIFVPKPFVEYTQEDFDGVTGINVTGVFHITQLALVEMLARGRGHVVNITAALVEQPRADIPAGLASLTKGGLDALTTALAIEHAKKGIRVNAVAPGVIETPMHDPASHDALAKLHPLRRMGVVKDVVDAVLYLDAAPFVTGEILHVDGGMAAGIG
ncbi:3-oxoacyl-[acyl-carrier protein] reductase [Minicystis rosea]|nr:3-oxoacyl-[acyl-carrier protein] reductase [Minicystis rosea]